jgi:tetratricopeptide (TPR) repeat protein
MNARLVLLVASLTAAALRAESPTDQLVNDGLGAFKVGDFDTAIGKFTEAIAKNPQDSVAYNDRGLAYKGKKDFEHAIADFTEASRLRSDWLAYYNRGVSYGEKGDPDRAIADFTKALKLNPKEPNVRADCFLGRGRAYFNKEKADSAMADLNAAIKLDDRNPEAYALRGVLHKINHNYDRSLADYETAIGLDPLNARSFNVEAYLLAVCPMPKYRDGKKAVAYATKACELTNWEDATYVETLAAAYAEAQEFDEAIKFQMKAAEIDPKAIDETRLALYRQRQPFRELNRKGIERAFPNLETIQNKLTIKFGQKLAGQFQVKDRELTDPKIVNADGQKPEKTPNCLWLDFREDKRGRVLFLWHSFPQTMQAKCLARLKGYDTYFETDILPVPVKAVSPEIWKEPIEELVLFDFKLTDLKRR